MNCIIKPFGVSLYPLHSSIFPVSPSRASINDKIDGKKSEGGDKDPGGTFRCFLCPLEEHFDYRGSKPPFSRDILYLEECYIMRDPFSPPNKGEVLVLGGDCSLCERTVCLGCSIFYTKRFCKECANNNVNLPIQLQSKVKSLNKSDN
ncbi:cysteine-rich DPF motif domain-containing protein 1 [Diachasmimorpha longicaudata]|uniref:cysteine-rich DPF motif domain-containing protein 1 n=1 Tax=Diachasmimorpha longicaudata TaxID=58733 RepID=UPI0030B8AFA4